MAKNLILATLILVAISSIAEAKTYKEMFGVEPPVLPAATSVVATMDFMQGSINLPGAGAHLTIPEGYYFLDPKDAKKLLVDIWKNPPDAAAGTLGMLFPAQYAPDRPELWGAVISYSPDGFVSDDDAESTDFDEVLKELQASTSENNRQREIEGFEPIKLVGWASPPHYDKANHALHWARDLLFGTDPAAPHTLNYQLRKLGREGVLELNFVAGMSDLPAIQASIPGVVGLVNFDPGKAYGDFKDGDKVAAYGLAGLIAAGAGAKLAAKVGFLALALAFLKKGAFLVVIALGAIFKPVMSFFRRKPDGTA
jgi:uncharacterized membrane-anchored protein